MRDAKSNSALALTALGVVYGDIGTSPLYALSTCFNNILINKINIFGVCSLIFWSLILVVSTCYLSIFLRASNDGEGGVLALLGLFNKKRKAYRWLLFIGILGAGLLISDGMLTPAISVISAVEGIKILSPELSDAVVPVTIAILALLFYCQHLGTQKIGKAFGPILLLWFIVIGLIGLRQIVYHPDILMALNPYYAYLFFQHNGFTGFLLLGSIFLCVTGAEAMYADLGQFGAKAIRTGWFCVVLPGLLLCFLGQGATLIDHPEAIASPFYLSAPAWCHRFLLILATAATIIASQSIISASYSLTKQGILLGVMPRLRVIQTSIEHTGQIFVPKINIIFAIGTIFLVLFFKSSAALTNAYGVAINLEMVIMAILVIYLAYAVWHWSIAKICRVFAVFVVIDVAFLIANGFKIIAGGWLPLAFALACLLIMMTWRQGMELLHKSFKRAPSSQHAPATLYHQLSGLEAILITNTYDQNGDCFLNYFEKMGARPSHWLIVTALVEPIPYLTPDKRYLLNTSPTGIAHLFIHFGFMEMIDIPRRLTEVSHAQLLPFNLNVLQAQYFIEEVALLDKPHQEKAFTFHWQRHLFKFMFRNTNGSLDRLEFLKLPYDRTIIIGAYAKL